MIVHLDPWMAYDSLIHAVICDSLSWVQVKLTVPIIYYSQLISTVSAIQILIIFSYYISIILQTLSPQKTNNQLKQPKTSDTSKVK